MESNTGYLLNSFLLYYFNFLTKKPFKSYLLNLPPPQYGLGATSTSLTAIISGWMVAILISKRMCYWAVTFGAPFAQLRIRISNRAQLIKSLHLSNRYNILLLLATICAVFLSIYCVISLAKSNTILIIAANIGIEINSEG